MKTFSLGIEPQTVKFRDELDVSNLMVSQNWVIMNDQPDQKETCIFRRSHRSLFISKNGRIEQGNWACLDTNNLLLNTHQGAFLFHPSNFDSGILGLKLDGKDEYALLVNESRYENGMRSTGEVIRFLEKQSTEPLPASRHPHPRVLSKDDAGILLFLAAAALVTLLAFRFFL